VSGSDPEQAEDEGVLEAVPRTAVEPRQPVNRDETTTSLVAAVTTLK